MRYTLKRIDHYDIDTNNKTTIEQYYEKTGSVGMDVDEFDIFRAICKMTNEPLIFTSDLSAKTITKTKNNKKYFTEYRLEPIFEEDDFKIEFTF